MDRILNFFFENLSTRGTEIKLEFETICFVKFSSLKLTGLVFFAKMTFAILSVRSIYIVVLPLGFRGKRKKC